jgi:hypothetical protein
LVVEERESGFDEKAKGMEDMMAELLDAGEGGIVEVEELDGEKDDAVSRTSGESRKTKAGFDFLEKLEDDSVDDELERSRWVDKKRKRTEEMTEVRTGTDGIQGWEWREREGREEKRWKREVTEERWGGNDEVTMEVKTEKIPLPDNYRLGLDGRGQKLNHSGRPRNSFGASREPLFRGGRNGKEESRNWVASFIKSGCLSCRDKNGKVTHKSRSGEPVVLVVGDEATPTVVGYTAAGSTEDTCAWILKKEHLGLDEVGGMLRKINNEKKAFDRQRGKRVHEFFIPMGSKILVGSYVHLRREGLEGYIESFNGMVSEVFGVTGDIGIEVLPFVPVVFDGIDDVGKELICGVQEWVKWIGRTSGRSEMERLSETGGVDVERSGGGNVHFWRPSFMILHGKQGGLDSLLSRGNKLTLMKGERKESIFEKAMPAREIARMNKKGKAEGADVEGEGGRERESFDDGISVEGEFAFTQAIGEFCRGSVSGGWYKGNYRFNLKGQMEERARETNEEKEKYGVVLIGASQMGRMKCEIEKLGCEGVDVVKMVKLSGLLTDEEVNKALRELEVIGEYPTSIVIGGPGNSLMEHGIGDWRGFGPERTVKVRQSTGGKVVERWEVRYHMDAPRKISMVEKRQLVDRVVRLVREAHELFPESLIVYVTMFPRHVEKCCEKEGLMKTADIIGLDSVRRDVDRDVIEMVQDLDKDIRVLQWWDMLGLDKDKNVNEVRVLRVIEGDEVHLTSRANRNAAVNLCRRVREMVRTAGRDLDTETEEDGCGKRRRIE